MTNDRRAEILDWDEVNLDVMAEQGFSEGQINAVRSIQTDETFQRIASPQTQNAMSRIVLLITSNSPLLPFTSSAEGYKSLSLVTALIRLYCEDLVNNVRESESSTDWEDAYDRFGDNIGVLYKFDLLGVNGPDALRVIMLRELMRAYKYALKTALSSQDRVDELSAGCLAVTDSLLSAAKIR